MRTDMIRVQDMRIRGDETHGAPQSYGRSWWSPRRDELLLRVMRDYGDLDKAARVVGCPRADIERRVKFHSYKHPELSAFV